MPYQGMWRAPVKKRTHKFFPKIDSVPHWLRKREAVSVGALWCWKTSYGSKLPHRGSKILSFLSCVLTNSCIKHILNLLKEKAKVSGPCSNLRVQRFHTIWGAELFYRPTWDFLRKTAILKGHNWKKDSELMGGTQHRLWFQAVTRKNFINNVWV